MSTLFAPAQRKRSKARIVVSGPSGAGKTYTALAIATGLADGGTIAVADTEYGSASLYAGQFTFDVAELNPPYSTSKYLDVIKQAADAGYAVVVLDSITHAWKGSGGVLDVVDKEKARERGGGGFSAWKVGDKLWREFIDAIVAAPIHVVATMRSKQEYVQERDDRGKTQIRKVGLAPEARDGIEYEFTLCLDMDLEHRAVVTKTRGGLLADEVIDKPGADVGRTVLDWLNEGTAPGPDEGVSAEPVEQVREEVLSLYGQVPEDQRDATDQWLAKQGVTSFDDMPYPVAVKVRDGLRAALAKIDQDGGA